MAYFPNGAAGSVLEDQCGECLHGRDDSVMCPVYFVQITFNYSQNGNTDLEKCLNWLVDEEGDCRMKDVLDQSGLFDIDETDLSDLEKWEKERGKL